MSVSELAGMGRVASPDPRDQRFMLPRTYSLLPYRYWITQPPLDQGDSPHCVGYSGFRWLTSYPVLNQPGFSASQLYKRAQQHDEWPGDDYDGSSVRGLFKYLKSVGYVSEYRWGFDADVVVDHVLSKGPVVVGTEWTKGMFMPDEEGYIDDFGGESAGGHAYLVTGASKIRSNSFGRVGAVRILNSWGEGWSDRGRAWMSLDFFRELMKRDGEACTATEVKSEIVVSSLDYQGPLTA